MKDLKFESLYSPEYYLEVPNHDNRIAAMKFQDTLTTLRMAQFSLLLIDSKPSGDTAKEFAKIVHIRHAIEDLNNSFDLLLQIPWFYYRIWDKNNKKNNGKIIRNTSNWVTDAEKKCEKQKVITFLDSISNSLGVKIRKFNDAYIEKNAKPFTVRTLCNMMKHRRALSFVEMYTPYDFNCNFNGEVVNLRESNITYESSVELHDSDKNIICYIKLKYCNDLSIDIEYSNGDLFYFKDCSHNEMQLNIPDIYAECCDFFDALADLLEDIYKNIFSDIPFLPVLLNLQNRAWYKACQE